MSNLHVPVEWAVYNILGELASVLDIMVTHLSVGLETVTQIGIPNVLISVSIPSP